jgi:C2 domain
LIFFFKIFFFMEKKMPHSFKREHYSRPTFCGCCGKLMFGVQHSCSMCNMPVHRRCIKYVRDKSCNEIRHEAAKKPDGVLNALDGGKRSLPPVDTIALLDSCRVSGWLEMDKASGTRPKKHSENNNNNDDGAAQSDGTTSRMMHWRKRWCIVSPDHFIYIFRKENTPQPLSVINLRQFARPSRITSSSSSSSSSSGDGVPPRSHVSAANAIESALGAGGQSRSARSAAVGDYAFEMAPRRTIDASSLNQSRAARQRAERLPFTFRATASHELQRWLTALNDAFDEIFEANADGVSLESTSSDFSQLMMSSATSLPHMQTRASSSRLDSIAASSSAGGSATQIFDDEAMMQRVCATLGCEVSAAKNLKASRALRTGGNSYFVQVKAMEHQLATSTQWDTPEPLWGESYRLGYENVDEAERGRLEFFVMQRAIAGLDHVVGRVLVPMEALADRAVHDEWHPLRKLDSEDQFVTGTVALELHFMPPLFDNGEAIGPGVLNVHVASARSLAPKGMFRFVSFRFAATC